MYTKEDILRIVDEEDVEFIRLQFTDIFGSMKNMAVTRSQLGKVLDEGWMFDGSQIKGFVGVEKSDIFLRPDPNSFVIFPWRPQSGKVARIMCDIYYPDGTPFEGDPRFVLEREVKKAAEMGYMLEAGHECEFFLFDHDDAGNPTRNTSERGEYFEMGTADFGENARRDIVLTLQDMGFEIEASHHEAAPGQHEIDFMYREAIRAADDVMTFKLAVKTVAKRHGLYATFMPKPNTEVNGSGMHINLSLKKGDKNVFYDPDCEDGLSQEARWFIGGLLDHMYGMCAVTNPLVNSYKRLIAGFEAPIYITWSLENRSPMIRIPSTHKGVNRIELRSPDSAANPYLTLALCLAAGLDGIKRKLDPPKSVVGNLFEMSDEERKAAGIKSLPRTLAEAVDAMKNDDFVRGVLGEHIFEAYTQAKEAEWDDFNKFVTDWEVRRYLGRY